MTEELGFEWVVYGKYLFRNGSTAILLDKDYKTIKELIDERGRRISVYSHNGHKYLSPMSQSPWDVVCYLGSDVIVNSNIEDYV